jgi:hypothetical protein
MESLSLTTHWAGMASLIVFVVACVFVVLEDVTHMRRGGGVTVLQHIVTQRVDERLLPRHRSPSQTPHLSVAHLRAALSDADAPLP